jgi:RP/EB family microtubule-associated protein
MKSKKLGRSELLNWVNKTVESDYVRIEDLSDGVGFCQIIDAFFKNVNREMNSLKLNAINEIELKQKNLSLLNSLLGKAGCIKQIDPNKLAKGLFSINLEFLQYLFDFIYKTFGSVIPKKKYRGLKRRIEIIKNQSGNKVFKNITRYLPSHLITNEVILQIEKDKFFNDEGSDSDFTESDDMGNYEEDNELKEKLEKYNLFFKLLEEDLIGYVDLNKKLSDEIHEIEEEKEYYLGKLHNICNFCENERKKTQNPSTKTLCDNIISRITSIPDDFK